MMDPMEPAPIFILGLQRSGTNMMLGLLGHAPGLAVFNEDDPRAFSDFRLRDTDTVETLIRRHLPDACVFKAITDTLRWRRLLEAFHGARLVFMVRNPFDVVLSWLVEFPSSMSVVNHVLDYDFFKRNGEFFADVAETPTVDAHVRRYFGRFHGDGDYANKVALFWLLFHGVLLDSMFFERRDVLVIDFDSLLASPDTHTSRVASFCEVTLPPACQTIPASTGGHYFAARMDVDLANDCRRLYERVLGIGSGSRHGAARAD